MLFNLPFFRQAPSILKWETEYLRHAARFATGTQRRIRFAFTQLKECVPGDTRATRLSKTTVLCVLTDLSLRRTACSVNEVAKSLRAAWNWGVEYLDLPTENPFRVQKFPQDEKPRHVPSLEDFQAVYNLASGRDALLLLTALHTAARRNELFRLTWQDVDLARKIIRLGTRKRRGGGMQYDWVPMTERLFTEFSSLRRDSKPSERIIFARKSGEPFKTRATLLRILCERAGVRRFGFHGIRHLSASMMARGNMPLPDIQHVLRHKSSTTTVKYIHSLGVTKENLDRIFCN